MAAAGSPTVRRLELGTQLRALRNGLNLTVEQVADQLLCSPSKISRLETGHRGATLRDVRDLCDLYGVTDRAERDRLMTLAREARRSAWWQSYDLNYSTYVGLEAEARSIKGFQSSVVPGLLQTAEYARAGHEGALPRHGPDEIERMIEAKLTRQLILTKPDAPSFDVVVDEAVLHRMTGGPTVMAAQRVRLIEAARLPNITIRVIPFTVGAHPGVESNFNILELPASLGVVFVEGLVGSIYLQKPEDLDRYRAVFDHLRNIALSPEDTLALIAGLHG